MGPAACKLSNLLNEWSNWGITKSNIIMIGLDNAGKTTILYHMIMGETITSIPTIGVNIETLIPRKGLKFTVWDVGGQSRVRPLWRNFMIQVDALIYVVDSDDRERLTEAQQELERMLARPEISGKPVLVLANKHDLPDALSCTEIAEHMYLHGLTDHNWTVQQTCAKTGEGLFEALDHLADMVKENTELQ